MQTVGIVQEVNEVEFYHINRILPYSPFSLMKVGDVIEAGHSFNPFFSFFNTVQTWPHRHEDGRVEDYPGITLLEEAKRGSIQGDILYSIGFDTADKFGKLARETILEIARAKTNAAAPSRWTCMWLCDQEQEAEAWLKIIRGDQRQLVKMRCSGVVMRADCKKFPALTETFDQMMSGAIEYWSGITTEDPLIECIFAGRATVVDVDAVDAFDGVGNTEGVG